VPDEARMAENFNLFHFQLTRDDLSKIATLDKRAAEGVNSDIER